MRKRLLGVVVAVALVGGCAGEDRRGGGGGDRPRVEVVAPTEPDAVVKLVEMAGDAVVNIDTVVETSRPHPLIEGFPEMRGLPPIEREERGVGSGFVIRPDGLIVTNYHVIQGASEVTVTLADGKSYKGRVVGSDSVTDLALVRIPARGLPILALAESDELKVGQYVVAMGSPLGLQHSVTMGILSAINRDLSLNARVGFLQTDAPINVGNSGGPLLNLQGEVIGVNTAVAAEAQGIGFAIPVGTLRNVLTQLEEKGRVAHPWLGVGVVALPEDREDFAYKGADGVVVGRVEPESPAARAGLRVGDVIVSVDGQPVSDPSELVRIVSGKEVGERVRLGVHRDGRERTVPLRLRAMPPQLAEGR